MMIRLAPPLSVACLAVLAAGAHPALAQGPGLPPLPNPGLAKPAPPAAKPKPAAAPEAAQDAAKYEAARAAFEALPEPLRKAVQDSLVWTGDYNAVTAGTFGRRTFEGILAWQRRARAEPTGILSAADRAALDAAGEVVRKAMRFTVQSDPGSGVVIGVPERLLSRRSPLPRGTRWQSADGRVTLDTVSHPPDGADLDALFERAIAASPERKVTYKLKKPDFFVVTGETAGGRFYIRNAAGPEGVRGFSIAYDKALAAETDRLVIAVTNSLVPFPAVQVPAPEKAAPDAASPGTPFAPPPPGFAARPAATGLALGPGQVLTAAAALESCSSPRIEGRPARLARRDATGALALLEAEPGRTAPPLPALRSEPPAPGEALVVLGAEASGPASVAPGVAGAGGVFAPLQPGAGGAPVLDRAGRLVGLVVGFPAAPRLIAGVMPPTSHRLVPAGAVITFLAQAGVEVAKGTPNPKAATLGAAAAPTLGAVVTIGCGVRG